MNALFQGWLCLLFRSDAMTPELGANNVFGTVGLIMLISSLVFSCVFYFLMDKSKFIGVLWWLLMLVIVFVLNLLQTFFIAKNALTKEELEFPATGYLYLGLIVALWAIVLYFIFSVILKRFTTNLARSPF
jgi:hypothetical protein